jgi:hypothetical protein
MARPVARKLFCQPAAVCYAAAMRFLICSLLCVFAGAAFGAEQRFNFSEFPLGAAPTNFQSVLVGQGRPPAWKILMEDAPSAFSALTPQSANHASRAVVAQTSMDGSDERFPILLLSDEIFRNFKFTTKIKMVDGLTEQMAGVVFRFQNSSNYYVVRASALGKNVRFYKMINGQRSAPIGPAVDVSAGAWHSLTVQCEGNQISIFFDDKLVMPPLGDNSLIEGRIGFITKSDAVSHFADPVVNFTPRLPAAQAMVNAVLEKQVRTLGLQVFIAETNRPGTRIIASKFPEEVGQPGDEAERAAIADGTVSFGRERGVVLVTMPFHDRNGEFIGAMRVKLKAFLGEMESTAITRATMILKLMESYCTTAAELRN